jgi:hypothetical protein
MLMLDSYERRAQPLPKLSAFAGALGRMLEDNGVSNAS